MKRLSVWMGGALLLLAACAGSGSAAGTRPGGGAGSHDVILVDEITRSGAPDMFAVVQSLRPQWLRPPRGQRGSAVGVNTSSGGTDSRGAGFAEGSVNVYLNNARMGTAQSLRTIPVAGVRYVRYFTPAQANLRWGSGNAGGAILVSTEELQP
jgi:hypothetical protein